MSKIQSIIMLMLLLFIGVSQVKGEDRNIISLNGKWTLSYWKQPQTPITSPEDMKRVEVKEISAQVPGNVELDLLAAGIIKDPMIGSNVNELRRMGRLSMVLF
jgi:beta-mannosidase